MELGFKVETAFAAVMRNLLVETAYAEVFISRGLEAEEMPVPRITFHCFNVQEEPDQTGNGFCDVLLKVRSPSDRHEDGDDPLGDHERLVSAAAAIWRTDLAALLTAAVESFSAEQEIEAYPGTRRTEGRCFVTEQRWRLYAYNCDLVA